MSITADTAAALDALAVTIEGLTTENSTVDVQYFALIAPAMLEIENRVMPAGFRYSLNVTYALLGRPKHWYMGLNEYNLRNPGTSSKSFAFVGFQYIPDIPLGFAYWANSTGNTIGLATLAALCKVWAQIIRLWLDGNYPPKSL